ncbi:hypothetical protein [Actinoplanes sp. NPDC049316]|uniref:hypothetical protein n=1 Tax=Actinoplanes sp. NPDC049316 TaxID=3154727 RepID=UPI00342D8013
MNHRGEFIWYQIGYVWAAVAAVVILLIAVGRYFSRRTLRVVTTLIALTGVITLAAWGQTTHRHFTAAFVDGAGNASDFFFAPLYALVPDRRPWPDDISVAAFGLVLVVLYWLLEGWSARFEPPTVHVDDDTNAADIVKEMQFRLPAVLVHRPSVVPGGAGSDTMAAVVAESQVPGAGLYAQLVRLAGAVWPRPPGFVVKVREEKPPASACVRPGRHVTVDVRDARTQQSRMVRTLCCGKEDVAERVAGFAARTVFAADVNTPRWSVGSFDGEDLAAYLMAQQMTANPCSSAEAGRLRDRKAELLDHAVRNSPGAGVTRYELALLRDLQGNHVAALHLHAVNCVQYPRFHRVRYRLAMSLEMVAGLDLASLWTRCAPDERVHLARMLRQCGLPERGFDPILDEALCMHPLGGSHARHLRRHMLVLAQRQFRRYRRTVGFWFLLGRCLAHRDQRGDLRPMLLPIRQARVARRRQLTGAKTAEALTAVRLAVLAGQWADIRRQIDRFSPDGGSGVRGWRWSWVALYNAACLHAVVVGAAATLDAPARASTGLPTGRQLTARAVALLQAVVDDRDCEMERPYDWISVDPDLRSLAAEPAFVTFLHSQHDRDYPATRVRDEG